MADIFGYSNSASSSGQVASADYAFVSTGGKNALVQSVDANYQQRVEEVTQVGDTQVYWMPGRPQGSVSISKLVGAGGFFSGWNIGQCGRIDSVNVSLNGGSCGFSGGGSLSFTGGVVESVSVRLGTEKQTIAETAQIKVSSMSA